MTIKVRWGNINGKGGRRKSIKYKTEWGYRGTYSSRTEWCKVSSFNRYWCLLELHELRPVQVNRIPPLGAFAPGGPLEVSDRDFHGSMGVDQLLSLYRAQDVCPIVHSM